MSGYLKEIDSEKLVELGQALGLDRMNLMRSNSKERIGDLVTYWIRRDDRVMEESGTPTWKSLAKALLKVHLTGISSDIQAQFKFNL